jgi:hypothetical protein
MTRATALTADEVEHAVAIFFVVSDTHNVRGLAAAVAGDLWWQLRERVRCIPRRRHAAIVSDSNYLECRDNRYTLPRASVASLAILRGNSIGETFASLLFIVPLVFRQARFECYRADYFGVLSEVANRNVEQALGEKNNRRGAWHPASSIIQTTTADD